MRCGTGWSWRSIALPAALLCASTVGSSEAGNYEAAFVRLASRPSDAVPVPHRPGGRARLLWRHQYEWTRHIGPTSDPSHAGGSGRILELAEIPDDGRLPGRPVWRYAFPYENAGPRPLHSEALTWDSDAYRVWVVTCSCGLKEAQVEVHRIPDDSVEPETLDERLEAWPTPRPPASRHVLALPPTWRNARVDFVYAIPEGATLLLAFVSITAKATLWRRFDPEADRWTVVETKDATPANGR